MKTITPEDINKAVNSYKNSPHKDSNKTKKLDAVSTYALIWQLLTGHFEIVPYSTKSFYRYLITGDSKIIYLINNYDDKYLRFRLI